MTPKGTEPVKPALTAEEWEELGNTNVVSLPNGEALSPERYSTGEIPRHMEAAIALYGQPFGFTREDLETLDDAIYAIHGPKMDGLHPGVEQLLDDLKCRIEALLPPEEK